MKSGKISETILKRSVLKPIAGRKGQNTILTPAFGEDCAAVSLAGGETVLFSSDTAVVTKESMGVFVFHTVINDLATAGAEPFGIMVNVMLPPRIREKFLRTLMEELNELCVPRNLEILGGHTEVSDAVREPVLTITGIGRSGEAGVLPTNGLRAGNEIVMTKWAAIQATALLSVRDRELLSEKLPEELLETAQAMRSQLSVTAEAAVGAQQGAVAMHNVSRGGVFGALWEFAAVSGVGLTVDLRKIPIRQETIEICEILDYNPYKILSGGSLLIGCNNGNHMAAKLKEEGISAEVIGYVTDSNDRIIINGEETRYIEQTGEDEILQRAWN